MTSYLAAAVVVVGLLCLLDLVLTFGVIRRLREHTKLLDGLMGGGMSGAAGLQVGERVGDFVATTTEGETVSRELLTAPALVGFFSPGCQPCADELPHFVDRAASMSRGGRQVLTVIDAEAGEGTEYVERLRPVAHVVRQPHGAPVPTAFGVQGYPTFYLLGEDGTVVATTSNVNTLDDLPDPATATA